MDYARNKSRNGYHIYTINKTEKLNVHTEYAVLFKIFYAFILKYIFTQNAQTDMFFYCVHWKEN